MKPVPSAQGTVNSVYIISSISVTASVDIKCLIFLIFQINNTQEIYFKKIYMYDEVTEDIFDMSDVIIF